MRLTTLLYSGLVLIGGAAGAFASSGLTYDGYTFCFSQNRAYLYTMDKTLHHYWEIDAPIAGCADLLRDSSIIVATRARGSMFTNLAVCHGRFQIISWSGETLWDYTYVDKGFHPHHDIEPVYRTSDPKETPTFLVPCYTMWGEKIVEIKPKGKYDAEIIWEWYASDHICLHNCYDKAHLLDVYETDPTYMNTFNSTSDAMHVNSLSYNRRLDQIIMSSKGYHELLIIDHSTTTEEAADSTGGRYGCGGDLIYRWGNPENYGVETTTGKQLTGQHHCCWIPDTMPGTSDAIPGGGNFLAVNTNRGRGNGFFMEILNPNLDGWYNRYSKLAFGPTTPCWTYSPEVPIQSNEGSIQKLPNGNYLICSGGYNVMSDNDNKSVVQEIHPRSASEIEVVWELRGIGTSCEAYRYAYGYLGTATATRPVATMSLPGTQSSMLIQRSRHGIVITAGTEAPAALRLYSLDGTLINKLKTNHTSPATWTLNALPAGTYLLRLQSGTTVSTRRIIF